MYLKIDVWTKTGYLWSALALVDSGSDVSLISKGTALLTGLGDDAVDVDPDKEVLRGVGGIAVPATHKLEAPWRELDGRNKWPTTFYVTELPEGVDVVLGQDWNKKSKYLKPDRTVLVANLTKRKGTHPRLTTHHSTATDLNTSFRNLRGNRQPHAAAGRASATQEDGQG